MFRFKNTNVNDTEKTENTRCAYRRRLTAPQLAQRILVALVAHLESQQRSLVKLGAAENLVENVAAAPGTPRCSLR